MRFTKKEKINKVAKRLSKEIPVLHFVESKTIIRKYFNGDWNSVMEWFKSHGGKLTPSSNSSYCECCSYFRGDSTLSFRGLELNVDNDCCGTIVSKVRDCYNSVMK
jgi:hypothetical protein